MKEYHKGMVEATIKGDKLSKEELIADLDYIEELENENDRLNNIINRMEEDLKEMYMTFGEFNEEYTEKKIRELKEGKE